MEKQSPHSPLKTARERILETAADLFYREGYHAVGVDTIVAQSGVAKMTLYRHFASKDDLIVAYLQDANEKFWEWFEGTIQSWEGSPRQQLIALFEGIARLTSEPGCYGCTFQNTAAEYPALEYPGHQVALAHKQAVRNRLRDLGAQAGAQDPDALADQLFLLMDGAWMAKRMFGSKNPAEQITGAARLLLDGHIPPETGASSRPSAA